MDERASMPGAFSDELEAWLRSDQPKTLGALNAVFEEKTFAVAIVLLMFVPAIPAPTGGITHVFEAVTVLIGLEMVAGLRTVWLPRRFRERSLGKLTTEKAVPFMVRRIRWFERFSRPRLALLFSQRWFLRVLGLIVIAFAAGAAVAPPFSGLDTLPALGAVLIGLAMILEDIVLVGIGIVIGTAGIALIVTIGAALAHYLRDLL
jgi:hypothetical protein